MSPVGIVMEWLDDVLVFSIPGAVALNTGSALPSFKNVSFFRKQHNEQEHRTEDKVQQQKSYLGIRTNIEHDRGFNTTLSHTTQHRI